MTESEQEMDLALIVEHEVKVCDLDWRNNYQIRDIKRVKVGMHVAFVYVLGICVCF